jgi:hypothetical protein
MAAGLGFIEFTTGDILTAATANGYLASQTVMVFASAAARTSAIASPQEGMMSYLKDTNSVEYYSGSAWVAVSGGGGGGGYTSLASGSLSGSSVTLNSISSAYEDLVLVWRNVSWTAADDRFRFTLNNVGTSAYTWLDTRNTSTSAASSIIQYQLTQVYTDNLKGGSTDNDTACILRIYDYANTTANKLYTMQYVGNNDANTFTRVGFISGVFDDTSAISRIDMSCLTAFAAGTYELFGVK